MKEKTQEQLPKIESTITQPSQTVIWVIIIVGSIIAITGAIYLGLGAGKSLAPIISNKQPKPTYVSLPIPTIEPGPSESIIRAPTVTPVITSEKLSPTPTISSDLINEDDYILDFSNIRIVTTNDLTNLSPWQLKVARNEIYARHGRNFVHQDLSCYFAKQSWYQVDADYSDSLLSKLETNNAIFILNYEKKISSPLINKDSGCDQDNP